MSTKLEYVSRNKQFRVTFEYTDEKDLFAQLAHFQEVFESNNVCKCGSDNVKLGYRVTGGGKYKYYDKKCEDCRLRFSYGQKTEDNALFPKHDKGWHRWVPEDNNAEEDSPKPKKVVGKK